MNAADDGSSARHAAREHGRDEDRTRGGCAGGYRLLDAGPHRWHLRRTGSGPTCLLLHGTGASMHSWAGLIPSLAQRHDVIAVDLPGHAGTVSPHAASLSLEAMARDVATLLDTLDATPALVVGHSAGAALLAELALNGDLPNARLVGLAPAMLLLDGVAGHLFPPLARIAAGIDWLPRLFARRARDPRQVQRLIDGTGSRVGPDFLAGYERLLSDPVHVANVLRMMAEWNLERLDARLPRLEAPFRLIAGANDRTVPLRTAYRTAALLPNATIEVLDGLGHLAHEEDPARVLALLDTLPPASANPSRRPSSAAPPDASTTRSAAPSAPPTEPERTGP